MTVHLLQYKNKQNKQYEIFQTYIHGIIKIYKWMMNQDLFVSIRALNPFKQSPYWQNHIKGNESLALLQLFHSWKGDYLTWSSSAGRAFNIICTYIYTYIHTFPSFIIFIYLFSQSENNKTNCCFRYINWHNHKLFIRCGI